MKTNNQVEVIVFKKEDKERRFLFLMLKRVPEKGGFWQPITGNVDPDEKFEEAAIRELEEELSITKVEELIDINYSFNFFDDNRNQLERVFGVRIASDIIPRLSREHTEMQWATSEECLNKYLKYPGNKEGLKELVKKLEGRNECSCSKG